MSLRRRLIDQLFRATFLAFIIFLVMIKFKQKVAILPPQRVTVEGRQLLVDFDRDGRYDPYFIKGVGYQPTPIGRHPSDRGWPPDSGVDRPANIFEDEELLRRDFALLKDMGCTTIRLWKADETRPNPNHLTRLTLDLAQEYGIKVIAGFWINTQLPTCYNFKKEYTFPDFSDPDVRKDHITRFVQMVNTFKDHPAILFWAIGNENNYHIDRRDPETLRAWYRLADDMAAAAHAAEGADYHPVALVNGEILDIGESLFGTTDQQLPHLDIWGVNVYRGRSFDNLFNFFSLRSEKPLWVAEFGLDAWNAPGPGTPSFGAVNEDLQAQWVGALWDEIVSRQDIAIGGTVMEYSDEWWQPNEWIEGGQYNDSQNFFGTGPTDLDCDGYVDWTPPAPDNFFHAEWWGLVAVQRNEETPGLDDVLPRKAFYRLKKSFQCPSGQPFYAGPENLKSCDQGQACCGTPEDVVRDGQCAPACSP